MNIDEVTNTHLVSCITLSVTLKEDRGGNIQICIFWNISDKVIDNVHDNINKKNLQCSPSP